MKYLLLLIAGLLLVGCGNAPITCIEDGYKGIVLEVRINEPSAYCSDGKLTPDKRSYITASGSMLIRNTNNQLHQYYSTELQ